LKANRASSVQLPTAGRSSVWGKLLYALLFVVALPLMLIGWSRCLDAQVDFVSPRLVSAGVGLGIAGLILMAAGCAALWRFGRGLPMSPFPPEKFVSQSVYRIVPHPIYVGWCLTVAGFFLALGSPGGFWIITPIVVLSCAAIVYGHELIGLDNRFGKNRKPPLVTIASAIDTAPALNDRISAYLLVFLPWLIAYETTVFVGIPRHAFEFAFSFERNLPVWEWTELPYACIYLWAALVPLLVRSKRQLREFEVSGLLVTLGGIGLFFLIPAVHEPRPFDAAGILGKLLLWDRAHDTAAAAFPAFHAIWALLSARACAQAYPKGKWFWYLLAGAVVGSCIMTGMHALLDILAAVLLVALVNIRHVVWNRVRLLTQRLANSWREWHVGPLRIIVHCLYSGLAAWIGSSLLAVFFPAMSVATILILNAAGIVGGALYAQWIEGSSRMLRPFGYFGTLSACTLLVALLGIFTDINGWQLAAALAIAATFTQAVGRLRCIVQGCCHGRPSSNENQGVRYWHPSTRVVRLATLTNVPIFPTPLYSVAWNLVVGCVLVRLWFLETPMSVIGGLYLILTGVGRFVEEAYRGEPQTPTVLGLRLYQWWSIGLATAGMVVSSIPSPLSPATIGWRWDLMAAALVAGILWATALSVDFPNSKRRYARLTG
jgi:protein-S-isoprenylcysteine O-methyltransferase Ste14